MVTNWAFYLLLKDSNDNAILVAYFFLFV
jgi:hypothetical protein